MEATTETKEFDLATDAPKKQRAPRARKKVETTPATTVSGRSAMSPEHKAALARGRETGRIVRNYLEALERNKPRRGRKRTIESVQRQIEEVTARLEEANSIRRLELTQQLLDLERERDERMSSQEEDLSDLETKFIEVAAEYAESKGLSYEAFRAVGVPPQVLRSAGVPR